MSTIDLPATFNYRLRQVMSSSISPGLLDGNPPPRRGAPGEDLVDPAHGSASAGSNIEPGTRTRLNREDSSDHDRDETVGCPLLSVAGTSICCACPARSVVADLIGGPLGRTRADCITHVLRGCRAPKSG